MANCEKNMPIFVEVENKQGKKVLINTNDIEEILEEADGLATIFFDGERSLMTKDAYSEVVGKLTR